MCLEQSDITHCCAQYKTVIIPFCNEVSECVCVYVSRTILSCLKCPHRKYSSWCCVISSSCVIKHIVSRLHWLFDLLGCDRPWHYTIASHLHCVKDPRRLTFTWWGFTTLACPLLFILFSCLFLSLWALHLHFILYILPITLHSLTLFFRSEFCFIGTLFFWS